MNDKYYNPFKYIAGLNSLLIGLVFLLLTSILATLAGIEFNGVIDVHLSLFPVPFLTHLLQQLLIISVIAVVFYTIGVISSKSRIRFLDVAGTMLLSRSVLFIAAFLFLFLPKTEITDFLNNLAQQPTSISPVSTRLVILLSAFLLIIIVSTIWMIALMFNAYKTSCNVKGSKAVISFISALIIAEILSLFLLRVLSLNAVAY